LPSSFSSSRYLYNFCTPVASVASCDFCTRSPTVQSLLSPSTTVRPARRHLIVVARYSRSMHGRQAFSVVGRATWNSLTDSIRVLRDPSLSIDSFRRQLKTFLFSNYALCIEHIRDILPMRYIDCRFTNLLTYLLTDVAIL